MVFQPIHPFSGIEGAVEDLGDLEFLRDKELSGDLISSTGNTTAVAPVTIASIIPATGKTFFIAKSSHIHSTAGATQDQTSQLQNDGVLKDEKRARSSLESAPVMEGTVVGDSLVGDGVKIYRIQKTAGVVGPIISATILGWIQDT